MNRFIIFTAALLVGLTVSTYSAEISGKVLNAEDSVIISGVTIVIEETGKQLTTDLNGSFSVSSEDDQLYLTVTHVGFVSKKNLLINQNEENYIYLTPSTTKFNPIVITAHRSQKVAFEVPQPLTVFDAEDIQERGATTISGVIQNTAGVDVNDAGPFRARPVIRGLFGSRTLVLVDGERLNDFREIVDFAGVSMSLVDVNEIQRVEVLNGPSSVLYGSDAMGGVINILTRERSFSEEKKPFVNYSSKFSSADRQASNRVNFGLESQNYSLSAGFLYKQAYKDYSPPDNWQFESARYNVYRPEFYDSLNTARGTSWPTDRVVNSRARVNNYDIGLAYKLNDMHRLDFDAGFFRGADIGFPGVPNASTPFYFFWPNHDRDNFSVTYSGRGFNGKLTKLDGKFYYQKISKDFSTDFMDAIVIPAGPPPNPPTITPLTSFSSTEVRKFGLNLQSHYQFSSRSQVTFGFDSWREEIDGRVISATHYEGFGPFPFTVHDTSSSVPKNYWHALGFYASSDLDFKKLLLTIGARFDNFWLNTEVTPGYVDENDNPLPSEKDTYNSVNGSVGIVVPVSTHLNAVGNLGTAYRVPNVVERFFYGSSEGNQVRPNSELEPERAVTVDLGIKASFERLSFSLLGFHSDYTNFTQLQIFDIDSTTSQPLWRYENVSEVSIYGFETVIEGKLESGVYGGLTFSYQHGDNETENEPLFVSPVKLGLKVGYRNSKKKFLGELNIYRNGEQNRVPKTSAINEMPTDGYTLVNSMVGLKVWENLLLTLNVNNLFDEVYSHAFNARNPYNPVPETGRNFILSAKVDVDI